MAVKASEVSRLLKKAGHRKHSKAKANSLRGWTSGFSVSQHGDVVHVEYTPAGMESTVFQRARNLEAYGETLRVAGYKTGTATKGLSLTVLVVAK